MKSPASLLGLIVIVLGLPLLYNSCQAGLLGAKGFSSAHSQCKAGLYKGSLANFADLAPPSPFADRKVRLGADNGAFQRKTGEAVVVSAGAELGVIADNSCLRTMESPDSSPLAARAAAADAMSPDLDQQAYLWTPERSYTEAELEAIAGSDPCVVGVSWNHKYKTQAVNDPNVINQAHLAAIQSEPSHPYFYNSTGGMTISNMDPVMVAVIDSGVDWQHPDLRANLWEHRDGIGIDITTIGGTVSYNPMDISPIGHGTHVSGLIAAVTNNGLGVAGAMPYRAKIMPIKLFALDPASGEVSTTSQHFFNALRFAHLNGANVINLSLGSITAGPSVDALAESAVNEALSRGAVVVTVIGNADGNVPAGLVNGTSLTVIPAMYATQPGVIGVGSLDVATGTKSNFSHFSTTYGEIAAPGAEAMGTGLYSTLPIGRNSYGRLSGTSQAAPLVSAAAAMAYGIIKEAYRTPPTPQEVERLILASAQKEPSLAVHFKDGNRLNLLRLAQVINAEYPLTRSSTPTPGDLNSLDLSSSGCR